MNRRRWVGKTERCQENEVLIPERDLLSKSLFYTLILQNRYSTAKSEYLYRPWNSCGWTFPYQYRLNGTSAWKKGSERRVTFGHLVLLIKAVGWDDADHKNLEYYTLLQLHVDSFKIQNVVVSETKEFLDGWKWDWNIGAACITWSVLWYYIITLSVVGRGAELHEADNNCLFMSIDFQTTSVFSEI